MHQVGNINVENFRKNIQKKKKEISLRRAV